MFFGLAFIALTVLILLAFYKTDLGSKFSHGLPDLFWGFTFSFFETSNAEKIADVELIALTGLSGFIAAALLVIATGLSRFLRRR